MQSSLKNIKSGNLTGTISASNIVHFVINSKPSMLWELKIA